MPPYEKLEIQNDEEQENKIAVELDLLFCKHFEDAVPIYSLFGKFLPLTSNQPTFWQVKNMYFIWK